MPIPVGIAKFFTSKLGLGLLFGLGIAAAVALTKWYIEDRAYDRGVADCQAEHAQNVAKANTAQAAQEDNQRQGATKIARESDAAAEAAVRATDTAMAETKEEIRYVYRDPPKTVPIAAGSCVHPLDDRVQQRIDQAVDSANRP